MLLRTLLFFYFHHTHTHTHTHTHICIYISVACKVADTSAGDALYTGVWLTWLLKLLFLKLCFIFIYSYNCNGFDGNIPTWIGGLSHLQSLVLRNNSFTGLIPTSVCNLSKLEILDCRFNSIEGGIKKLVNLAIWRFCILPIISFQEQHPAQFPTYPHLKYLVCHIISYQVRYFHCIIIAFPFSQATIGHDFFFVVYVFMLDKTSKYTVFGGEMWLHCSCLCHIQPYSIVLHKLKTFVSGSSRTGILCCNLSYSNGPIKSYMKWPPLCLFHFHSKNFLY